MAEPAKKELIETIKKIPIFLGLSPTQIRKILEISTSKAFKAEEKLCRAGSPSEELFILIAGELAVVTGAGERVASIFPVPRIWATCSNSSAISPTTSRNPATW